MMIGLGFDAQVGRGEVVEPEDAIDIANAIVDDDLRNFMGLSSKEMIGPRVSV
ncbi:hypothetical protein TorRG33x02_086390 [Trema orientale]|uniref:Uncharacterized protein n=1 Tax=Trema orientale TaxID=63057 RepID=A0A2P5FCI5_TREOI|nr:hypothetical protein TorRG33x02_086390 [Trema orientale]